MRRHPFDTRSPFGLDSPFGQQGGGGAAAFDPATLFAGGEEGVWYDPSDLSTMFQDDAETTPVTADGDPVAVILDKSGNGYHARMTTAARRPQYKTSSGLHWLQFDGADDALLPDTLSMSPGAGTADWSTSYGLNSNSDANYILLGNDGDGTTFGLIAQNGSTSTAIIATGGTLASIDVDGSGLTLSGLTRDDVHTALGGTHVLRVQYGVTSAQGWTTPILGQYFTPGTFSFSGFLYSVILTQRALTAAEKSSVDTYIASKSGVTL